MRLAEILHTILSSKKLDPNGRKRREQRFDVRAPLMLRPLAIGDTISPPWKCWLRNLSASGCCIVSPRRIEPGQSFVLRMPGLEGVGEIDMCYEVVRCSRVADDVFHIGAKRAGELAKSAKPQANRAVPATSPAPAATSATKDIAEADRIRAAMFGG